MEFTFFGGFLMFFAKNKAATTTEYGLFIGLIAVLLIGTVSSVGQNIADLFTSSEHTLNLANPDTNFAPTWTGTTVSGNALQSYALAHNISLPAAIDEDGDTVSITVSGDLWGLSYDAATNSLTGTPTQSGDLTFTATAFDGEASTDQTFTLTISPIPSSCADIVDSDYDTGSGYYSLLLGGGSAQTQYCDMDTDGGGWTLSERITTNSHAGATQRWISYITAPSYEYSEILLRFNASQYMNFATSGSRLRSAGSIIFSATLLRSSSRGWVSLSNATILSYVSGTNCLGSTEGSHPTNYCANLVKVSRQSGETFNAIADSETVSGSSYTDNLMVPDFTVYYR